MERLPVPAPVKEISCKITSIFNNVDQQISKEGWCLNCKVGEVQDIQTTVCVIVLRWNLCGVITFG
jgi:hypothetical protein